MIPMFTVGFIGFIVMMLILKTVSGFNHNQLLRSPFDVKLLQFSYPLMFVAMLQTFMHWIDILMLGYFIDAGTVGLYHPAARTAGLLQALLLSFLSIYAPMASQYYGEGKAKELTSIYKLVSRWLLICAIPISSVFILFPKKVLLLLNIFLIPQYGIIGAAWATFISLTFIGLVRVIEVGFILKMNFIDTKILKPIIAGIITYQILYIIKSYIMIYHTLITLGIASMSSLVIFGSIIWLLRIEDDDKDFLSGLGIIKASIIKNEN